MSQSTAPSLAQRSDDMSLWPTENGPWYPGENGRFDHGWRWCAAADCHPDEQPTNYPHPDRGPADHCWTPQYPFLRDTRAGLNGHPVHLRAFMAAPFQFGVPVGPAPWDGPRLFIDFARGDEDVEGVSLSLGDALLFVRHIEHAVTVVLHHTPPRVLG